MDSQPPGEAPEMGPANLDLGRPPGPPVLPPLLPTAFRAQALADASPGDLDLPAR